MGNYASFELRKHQGRHPQSRSIYGPTPNATPTDENAFSLFLSDDTADATLLMTREARPHQQPSHH